MANYYLDGKGRLINFNKKKGTNYVIGEDGRLRAIPPKPSADIAPVVTSKKEEEKDTWFKAGGFSDGVDGIGDFFGDLGQTILGTVGDIGVGVGKGLGGLVEGVVDLGTYAVSGVSDFFGADEFAKDAKNFAKENQTDKIFKGAEDFVDQYSVLGNKSDNITQGLGYVGGILATGGLGASAGLGSAGATALTTGLTFTSSMGGGMSEAYSGGATDEEAVTYGAIKGAGDAVTELIFGGLGKAVKATGLSTGLSSADDILAKKLSSKITNQIGKNLVEYGVKAGAEGTEEVLAGIVSIAGKKATYLSEEELGKIIEDENLLEQFIAGAVTSGIAQSGYVPGMTQGSLREANKAGRDFISGYTANEQTVIDSEVDKRVKEFEKNGKKVDGKQKNKIIEEVENDLKKGFIGVDAIESALGGETYKKYNSLLEESQEFQKLYTTKDSELSEEQRDRRDALKEKNARKPYESELESLKQQLSQEIDTNTQNDTFIRESFNEKARRGQKFEADLTKYDAKQAEIVKGAVESGILNNTTRTHEFVDMVAKISADKGVSFDFTNNEKLKESGFALEGKTINGFVKDGKIAVNINSQKALNTVVGHEITHVLEGTELYTELQTAIFDYAKTKGEYDSRYEALEKLYKGVENANIENELTADLVGDYLFTDSDFISRLSVEKPNIFKRIYEEIKYLVKTVTGNKEARELEKVKRAFDKAYKESSNTTESNTAKYAMEDIANMNEKSYNHHGWAKVNDVVTDVEMADFLSKVGEKQKNNKWYLNLGNGRHMFAVGQEGVNNTLIISDGNFNAPSIEKVYHIGLNNETDIEVMRDVLYESEQDSGWTLQSNVIKEIFGDEIIGIYTVDDFSNYREISRSGKGTESKGNSQSDAGLQNGRGSNAEIKYPLDNKTSSKDGVFSDTKNSTVSEDVQYSLNDDIKKAEDHFGTTYKINEAGYLLTDGKLLDFSGKHEGAPGGYRTVDHRDIADAFDGDYGDGSYSGSMIQFMQAGNIRLSPESGGINLAVKPNKEQLNALDRYITNFRGEVVLDIDDANGNTVVSVEYPVRTYSKRIINDINEYFDKGVIPEPPSSLGQFRYSLSEDSEGKQLSEGQMEYFKDSKIVDDNGKLKVMYHGSPFTFTKFEDRPSVNGRVYGDGFYFTESKKQASQWGSGGKIYKSYLNITKPFVVSSTEPIPADVMKALKEQKGKVYDKLSVDPKWWGNKYTKEEFIENEAKEYADTKKAFTWLDNKTDILKALGYDGVVVMNESTRSDWKGMKYQEVVAFDSSQIKKTTNTKPTSDSDIRHSLGNEVAPTGNYNVYGKDIAFEAPVKETVSKKETVDEYAPLTEEMANERDEQQSDRLNTLNESDMPEEAEAPIDEVQVLYSLEEEQKEKVAEIDEVVNAEDSEEPAQLPTVESYDTKLENYQKALEGYKTARSTIESAFDEAINKKEKEYNALKRKDTKKASNLLMQIENLKLRKSNNATTLDTKIAKVEATIDKLENGIPTKRQIYHRNIVDKIKNAFSSKGFDFDKVLEKAKDKNTFSSVDNTPQRFIEKSLGYKEGQILNDLTVNKVAQNETEGIKWLNSFTDKKSGLLAKISKEYGIKPRSKESASAQMYAEGFWVDDEGNFIKYGDEELVKDYPDAKVRENIKKLAKDERIRKIYDETLEMINASRKRNLYPEIPRRNNYFLHFREMNDTFSKLGIPFNPNDIKLKDLPTDINGMTADLKPGQPYFASAKQRMGYKTTYDLVGGVERYLNSAKNQIYHIDDIQTLRALRNYIADNFGQAKGLESLDSMTEEEAMARIEEVYNSHLSTFAKFLNEEANILAGKTSLTDRGLEGVIGRRGIQFLDTVNRQVGSNMVGGNVSSALTNTVSMVQTVAKSNKFDAVKAFAQTVSNKLGSIVGKTDGFAENNPMMIRRKGVERLTKTFWESTADKGYFLMSAIDSVSSEFIARTKFNELTRKGMSEQQAHIEADKWASRILGDRSLGQQPQLYNSKMLGLITKFQLEVRNQLDSQFYDTIQEAKVANEEIESRLARNMKTSAKVASTFFQLAVLQHLFGKAFESIAGYNPAFDIVEALIQVLGLDDDEESEDTVLDNIEEGFLTLLGDLPYTSTLTGGRIPISSALPVEQFITGKDDYGNEKSRWETIKETAPYYLLPTGYGQIKKTTQGLNMFSDEHPVSGSYTDSGNLRFPIEDTPLNRAQAGIFGQWANENARDYFDNERKPLKEKQIEEFAELDIPIKDYWEYREGLTKQDTLEEKFDYVAGLDFPVEKKNIMINNIVDRKEEVDLTNYDDFGDYEEFDFAVKNAEKYEFLQSINVSYKDYIKNDETKEAYNWAYQNPEKYVMSKAVGDVVTYRRYAKEINDIESDKDENGKTINGSKKEKVARYIDSLNMEYGAKITLFKSLYKADDSYNNEIVEYLNNRDDITYNEMVTILTELDFNVSADGTVWWD
jgi:hypothetical protein